MLLPLQKLLHWRTGGFRRSAILLSSTLAFFAVAALASCSSSGDQHVAGTPVGPYTLANFDGNNQIHYPSFVKAEVRDGYEYALAHPDQLEYMPCYCGCGLTANHKSNLDCYVAGVDASGGAVFDNHASFCDICLEITRDVKRLSAEGKSLRDIRAYVDDAHGEKGPGTETPQPPL